MSDQRTNPGKVSWTDLTPAQVAVLAACKRGERGLKMGTAIIRGQSIRVARWLAERGLLSEGQPQFLSGHAYTITGAGRFSLAGHEGRPT